MSEEQKLDMSLAIGDVNNMDNITRWKVGLAFYAEQSYSRGCYVRMLTGSMCSDADVVVDQELTDRAIKNLDQFLFVGTSENYTATVDAFLRVAATALPAVDPSTFHANHGVAEDRWTYRLQPAARIEKTIVAELSHNLECERAADIMVHTGKVKYDDPFDQAVYERAKVLFETKFGRPDTDTDESGA